jgi:hypothetical protein
LDNAYHDATGAACVPAAFRDNGDGTVTDLANKLLWTRCSVDGTGALANGDDFGCVVPTAPGDVVSWERALGFCDQLEHAGRSDWVLPDIARLATLVADSGDPAIDQTAFPNSSNLVYQSATSYVDARANWSALFGYGGYTGPGHGGKIRAGGGFVRCVAGARTPSSPALNAIDVAWTYADRIGIRVPSFRTAAATAPTKLAYLGVDGVIAVTGTTVTGALAGPIDLAALGSPTYEFGDLAAGTAHRVIVVAASDRGDSVAEVVASTGPLAPVIGWIYTAVSADDSITLAPPLYSVVGTPAPTVLAYLGVDGVIAVNGTVVTGYVRGPVAMSDSDHTFVDLPSATRYRIIVVAQNAAGYSIAQRTEMLGIYLDLRDGTVSDGRLLWRKCVAGQDWTGPDTNTCLGPGSRLKFCPEASNLCNGGINTGLLGPPWFHPPRDIDPYGTGLSEVWDACHDSFAGRSDWRVPTRDEMRTAYDFLDSPAAFPNAPFSRYWTANSQTYGHASAAFDDTDLAGKTDDYVVRCVAPMR